MRKLFLVAVTSFSLMYAATAQEWNGLGVGLGNLYRLSSAESRSLTAENPTGERGGGAKAVPSTEITRNYNNSSRASIDLGEGWKVNPYIFIQPKETITIAEIDGPGCINHIWLTTHMNNVFRWMILRIYWDDEKTPSVECPLADFFCSGWGEEFTMSSLAVCVNPRRGFNCYWQMPFRKKCRITIENLNEKKETNLCYQIDYSLTDVPEDAAYFHAQFRRTPWNEPSVFTILDGVKGQGQFVGVYMAWGVHNNKWWGEGEVKFYIDGDKKYPTICGTGLEDYFGGAYDWMMNGQYTEYSTPYAGLCQIIRPDGGYNAQERFGLYRWHIADPIRFKKDLKVTVQDLGWREDKTYLPQHSDISATSFWYQKEPHAKFPELPSWRELATY